MSLLLNDTIIVRCYTESIVDGRVVQTLTNTYSTKCALMPAALTEMSDKVSENVLIESDGDRITNYKKAYTKTKLNSTDIVVEVATGLIFKVMKVFDYSRFGVMANHYKYILALVE